MDQNLINDIIEWDIKNWSKALDFWDKKIDIKDKNLHCLELGGRRGGLSLWLGINKNQVICSDLDNPENIASVLHKKYQLDNIKYEAINATNIKYENTFDIVIFKSILGGISRNDNKLKKQIISQIYKSLKPNGKLLFAENLEASFFHKLARNLFIKWSKEWNYLKYEETKELFSDFKKVEFITVGFFATFGRSEKQRAFLAKIDDFIDSFIPENKKYILIAYLEK